MTMPDEGARMSYPGGKSGSGVYQTIINLMPPHRVYIEAFLGGGAIMRLKRPAMASIGIDADMVPLDQFPKEEVSNLELIRTDAIEWLDHNTFSDDTLIYLDPPYLMGTRSSQRRLYQYELSDEDHIHLLEVINKLTCMVMISGYPSDFYQAALSSWRLIQFQARTRGGSMATECVWLNFPSPLELHDYRYLGRNFRERERIKRRKSRWKNRLLIMPELERFAIMEAIEEMRSSSAISDEVTR
jgi:hypothetical protein